MTLSSYAKSNDFKTFMLLFEKDFPEMAATRYEQNEEFFVKMFSDTEMMRQVMEAIGSVVYQRLRKVRKKCDMNLQVAESPPNYGD